ncbi:MAG: twin-arginine translocation signal domain-containing protein [Chloroflexi bacterium]|nr:twin-arginine translocation signal domain-containing protein [Chloroflexota bacterium]
MTTHGKTTRRAFLQAAGLGAAAAAVASCGGVPASPPAPAATTAPAAGVAPTAAPAAPAVSKAGGKVVLTRYMTGGYTTPGPDDALVKQFQEEAIRKEYGLNVDIQYESASWADIDQLMEVRLQTQAVDTLQRHDRAASRWISTPGMIRDIDAEVKQYGKNLLAGLPKAGWEYFMRDDRKYIAIPAMRSAVTDIEFIHIRRDWLDKVNRPIPTTVEELEEVLRLFKEKSLGGSVTIPFANENPLWMLANCLIGPWLPEAEQQFALMSQGRNLELTGALNEERLTLLQRWYKEGLLNKEWTTWKYDQVYDACTKGFVGCLGGGWGLTNGIIKRQVVKADPSQDWVQIFPPLARKGVANSGRIRTGHPLERGLVVTSWAQQPEAIVALADWDNASYENWLTSRLGLKDKHWKYGENNTIVDLRKPGAQAEYSGMRGTTWTSEWLRKRNLAPAPASDPYLDPEVSARVLTNVHTRKDATKPEPGEYPAMPYIDRYTPYSYPNSQKLEGDMNTTINEYFNKIVNGELAVKEGAQQAYTRWLAAGGEVRMKEITDQYAKWIATHPEWKDPKATFAPEAWNTTAKYPERPKR